MTPVNNIVIIGWRECEGVALITSYFTKVFLGQARFHMPVEYLHESVQRAVEIINLSLIGREFEDKDENLVVLFKLFFCCSYFSFIKCSFLYLLVSLSDPCQIVEHTH